ncbi:MAG: hypothetical protein BECKG1743E_GA0114224_102725, partial [Candidatus Kentron sp. G]
MVFSLDFIGKAPAGFTDQPDAASLLRPSKFEGHCPMIRHGCRMALMVA